jgi:hypothetical protein
VTLVCLGTRHVIAGYGGTEYLPEFPNRWTVLDCAREVGLCGEGNSVEE